MSILVLSFALCFVAGDGDNESWGGFRGSNGSSSASSATLPDAFTEESVQWRADVPPGYSSPVVTGDAILLTGVEGKSLYTVCLDRRTGTERWRAEVEFDGKRAGIGSAAAPSPVTNGSLVFVVFQRVGVIAYDLDGEEQWRQSLGKLSIPHGLSASPVLHGDVVIMQVDEDLKAYVVAFDQKTGDERWRTERPGFLHGYGTPSIYAPADGPAEVILNGSFKICGYSVATGELLWWVNGASYSGMTQPLIVGDRCFVNAYQLPTSEFGMPPLDMTFEQLLEKHDADESGFVDKAEWKDDMIQQIWFIIDLDDDNRLDATEWKVMQRTDSETGALFAIRLGGRGDVTETHVAWKYEKRRGLSSIPSPVLVGEGLFMIKEGGIFSCFDVDSGELVKVGRVGSPDPYYASPVAGGDKILTVSASGQVSVIRAGKDWEVVSSENLEKEIWATPAIAGGQIFLRTQKEILAFGDVVDG